MFCQGCFHTLLKDMDVFEARTGRKAIFEKPTKWMKREGWHALDPDNPHTPLILAARADPYGSAHLVYCDWLEERGEIWDARYHRLACQFPHGFHYHYHSPEHHELDYHLHWQVRSENIVVIETKDGNFERRYRWHALVVTPLYFTEPRWWLEVPRSWDEPYEWCIRQPEWFRRREKNQPANAYGVQFYKPPAEQYKKERKFLEAIAGPKIDDILSGKEKNLAGNTEADECEVNIAHTKPDESTESSDKAPCNLGQYG